MKDDLYELSDTLFEIRRDFLQHEVEGIHMTAAQVRQLTDGLLTLGMLALSREHEISRHRWNAQCRAERQAEEQMLAELARPGTNVVLLHGDVHDGEHSGPRGAA